MGIDRQANFLFVRRGSLKGNGNSSLHLIELYALITYKLAFVKSFGKVKKWSLFFLISMLIQF